MAGAGFEPAKAVPIGLQPIPFDRSGTPPRRVEHSDQLGSPDGSGRPQASSNSAYFGPPNSNVAAIDGLSWDQPSSSVGYQHEEPVTTRCAEVLNDAAPARVAAPGASHDSPASVPVARHRLDLHAMKPLSVVGNHIAVRTMSDR